MSRCSVLDRFRRWHDEARRVLGFDADVVALATANSAGVPAVRFVHFTELRPEGFVFYTHYGSRKCRELAANPAAALVFYWPPHRRQVRVESSCRRFSREHSVRYFAGRDRESQLTTLASRQSSTPCVAPTQGRN